MTPKVTNVCHSVFLYQYIKYFVYSLRLQRGRNTAPLAPISATVMLQKHDYMRTRPYDMKKSKHSEIDKRKFEYD